MTALADQLRLEVLASSVEANLISNHSAQAGVTTGWTKESTYPDATFTADSGLDWGYEGKAFKLLIGPTRIGGSLTRRGYGDCSMVSDNIPVVGLQWVNIAATFRAPAGRRRGVNYGIQFYNGSDVPLGTRAFRTFCLFPHGPQWVPDVDNTFSLDTYAQSGGYWEFWPVEGPIQAPSTTAYMRITMSISQTYDAQFGPTWEEPTPTWVSKIMVTTAESKSKASGIVFSDEAESWQNVIPKALTARVLRGGDVDGVSDKLDAGLMVATVKDPLLTPENNDRIRPGRPIRLMGLNGDEWEEVFKGKLSIATTSYAGAVPIVTLTASDAGADLDNYAAPIARSGRFKQRVDSAMLDVPISYTVADTDANETQEPIAANENGTPLSQLVTIRDSLLGLYYVDKSNILRCFAANSYPSQTPTVSFSDDEQNEPDTVGYTNIDTNFDSKNMVNTLLVVKKANGEPDGEKTYGPYINQESVDAWGSVSATLNVNDGQPGELAASYLSAYANPSIFAESLTFDATANVATAIERELYEAAEVKFDKAGLDTVYRVINIEHVIDAEKWTVTLKFKPMESTSSIVVTDPPGGPDTGPGDLDIGFGTGYPRIGSVSRSASSGAFNFASGVERKVSFAATDVELSDGIEWDDANDQFKITRAGRYLPAGSIQFAGNANGVRVANINVNNAPRAGASATPNTTNALTLAVPSRPLKLAVGDVVSLTGTQTSGAAVAIGNVDYRTFLTLVYIGP